MAEAIGIELGKLVVEKLGFKAGKLIMSVKDINSQIQRLQETKSIIEATLRDADPLESCSSVEGKMIRNLHGIEARLEYFFDEKQTRAKQKELMGGSRHSKELRLFFSSSNQLVSPLRTEKSNEGMNETRKTLLKKLPIFLDDFGLLEDKLPFLVFLRRFVSTQVLPPQYLLTIRTIDISNSMKASHELPIFFRSNLNIHSMGKQKGTAISSLESFGDNIIMKTNLISTIKAAIHPGST